MIGALITDLRQKNKPREQEEYLFQTHRTIKHFTNSISSYFTKHFNIAELKKEQDHYTMKNIATK